MYLSCSCFVSLLGFPIVKCLIDTNLFLFKSSLFCVLLVCYLYTHVLWPSFEIQNNEVFFSDKEAGLSMQIERYLFKDMFGFVLFCISTFKLNL